MIKARLLNKHKVMLLTSVELGVTLTHGLLGDGLGADRTENGS